MKTPRSSAVRPDPRRRYSVGDRKRSSWVACTTLALGVFFVIEQRADAAILLLKNSDEALHVRTIRESESSIVVGVPQADGTFAERIIDKRTVDDFIRTVSTERLTALDPATPAMYRDYAEELAEKKVDPDARDAAIRLYLIAAYLDGGDLARSSMLGVTALARSAAEERKFRAMAYLLDPKHDRRVLSTPASAARAAGDDAESRDALLAVMRTLRQGNRRVAERMADRPSVIAAFGRYGGGFSHDDFLAACKGAGELDSATLVRVIRMELHVSGAKVAEVDAGEAASGAGWSATLESGDTAPVPSLSLRTLTEFDPQLSVFRNGKWVSK